MAGIPADFDQLALPGSELDWGDVMQIREKLALTPSQRLRAAQDLMNRALRVRAQNGGRAPL